MEKVLIDDMKLFKYLSRLKYSPSGKSYAFIVKSASKENSYHSAVYLCNSQKEIIPLTEPKGNVGFFEWLDDENIIFSEIRDEKIKNRIKEGEEISSFYKISVKGGEAAHLFDVNLKAADILPLGDEKYLISAVFNNAYPDVSGKDDFEKSKLLKEFKKEQDYKVVDELPFYFNGKGFINKMRSRLYIYEKGNLTPITGNLYNTNKFALSPCKKYILHTGLAYEDIMDQRSEINLYDIEKKETLNLAGLKYYISAIDFVKDKIVFAASERKLFGTVEDPDFYCVDINKNVELLSKFGKSVGSLPGSDCRLGGGNSFKEYNGALYFISLDNHYTDLYKLDLEQKSIEKITDFKGSIDFFDISHEGIALAGFFKDHLQEIYEIKQNDLEKISKFNAWVKEERYYSKPVHHVFTDKDGYEIDGWALLPKDYDENKKYPCILNIHGGPKAAYGDIYFHEMQYWASEGYFVIFSNPRGSDGKGNDFANIRGIYGTVDYEDIMLFTDEMLKKYPAIDENRLGVTGGSYGGYMTNWIIGHTHRFKAAASQRSIASWMSLTYTSDIGYYFDTDQARADAWNNPKQVWDMSPLKFAENVKTPLLLLHSDEDFRCGIWEAYQMFTAVKLRGVESKIFIFHGENHELSRSGKPDHRERRLLELTSWMDKYLK